MADQPTNEQLDAVMRFRIKHGRCWKQALREAWETGNYGTGVNAGLLQQVRNQFGPRWLINYRSQA